MLRQGDKIKITTSINWTKTLRLLTTCNISITYATSIYSHKLLNYSQVVTSVCPMSHPWTLYKFITKEKHHIGLTIWKHSRKCLILYPRPPTPFFPPPPPPPQTKKKRLKDKWTLRLVTSRDISMPYVTSMNSLQVHYQRQTSYRTYNLKT